MLIEKAFRRLMPEYIEMLFDKPTDLIRLTYIEILTLVQDLLGRYSSKGNITVFMVPEDVEVLIQEAISKIRAFEINKPKQFVRPLNQGEIHFLRIIKLTLEFDKIRRPDIVRTVIAFKVEEVDKIDPQKHAGQIAIPYGKVTHFNRNYIIFVDAEAEVLSISSQEYATNEFTFSTFREALFGKQDIHDLYEAYKRLMIVVNTRQKKIGNLNTSEASSQIKLFESLRKTLIDCASENVFSAMSLKSNYEQSKGSSKETINAIDQFLDELLNEYQLLRKPIPSRFTPPHASQRKTHSRSKKQPTLNKQH